MPLRLIMMGTPAFSVPMLSELIAAGHEIAAVYTQPPRPAGRGLEPTPSPVQRFAEAAGLKVLSPRSLKGAAEQAEFAALRADAAVVVAYGLLLPEAVLHAPRLGCYNMHASALPRWRGAAPIQRAIMAGDTSTAAMVMRMELGLDTGPVCVAETMPIGPDTTAGELHDRLSTIGAGLMVRALAALERGSLTETPQSGDGITYARKIEKSELRIDLSRPAQEVHDHIRGLSPAPGAWLELPVGAGFERAKVLRSRIIESTGRQAAAGTTLDDRLTIACGAGAIRLVEVQRPGKKAMPAEDVLRGLQVPAGVALPHSDSALR